MTWRPSVPLGGDEPRRLSDSLPAVARRIGGPDGAHLVFLANRWAGIVGPAVAGHSRPLRIERGTLVVAVDQPGWATELRYLEASLRARLDDALGAGVVTGVTVVVRPR